MINKKEKKTEKPDIKKKAYVKKGGNGGAREGSGRESFEPEDSERKKVEAMSGYGVPIHQIAVLVRDGIHVETLTKYFSKELIAGKAKANAKIGLTLFQKAQGGDTAAMIWWSKTQMKWVETKAIDLTSSDGTMTPKDTMNLELVSSEVLEALRQSQVVDSESEDDLTKSK